MKNDIENHERSEGLSDEELYNLFRTLNTALEGLLDGLERTRRSTRAGSDGRPAPAPARRGPGRLYDVALAMDADAVEKYGTEMVTRILKTEPRTLPNGTVVWCGKDLHLDGADLEDRIHLMLIGHADSQEPGVFDYTEVRRTPHEYGEDRYALNIRNSRLPMFSADLRRVGDLNWPDEPEA